jgi:hypothetical protein
MNTETAKLYNVNRQAMKKGWIILKSAPIPRQPATAPGFVTICQIDGMHPYVVHFFNAEDGGFHSGDYCKTYEQAEEHFTRRSRKYRGDNVCPDCNVLRRAAGGFRCPDCGDDI